MIIIHFWGPISKTFRNPLSPISFLKFSPPNYVDHCFRIDKCALLNDRMHSTNPTIRHMVVARTTANGCWVTSQNSLQQLFNTSGKQEEGSQLPKAAWKACEALLSWFTEGQKLAQWIWRDHSGICSKLFTGTSLWSVWSPFPYGMFATIVASAVCRILHQRRIRPLVSSQWAIYQYSLNPCGISQRQYKLCGKTEFCSLDWFGSCYGHFVC